MWNLTVVFSLVLATILLLSWNYLGEIRLEQPKVMANETNATNATVENATASDAECAVDSDCTVAIADCSRCFFAAVKVGDSPQFDCSAYTGPMCKAYPLIRAVCVDGLCKEAKRINVNGTLPICVRGNCTELIKIINRTRA